MVAKTTIMHQIEADDIPSYSSCVFSCRTHTHEYITSHEYIIQKFPLR